MTIAVAKARIEARIEARAHKRLERRPAQCEHMLANRHISQQTSGETPCDKAPKAPRSSPLGRDHFSLTDED